MHTTTRRDALVTAATVLVLCGTARVARAGQQPQEPAGRAEPLPIGETFTMRSAVLGEARRINVYLPPEYRESPAVRLPVLYMPDGGVAEDFLHIAGLVQILVANGTMRPFIVVGIENTERRRDMTGPTTSDEDRRIAPRVGGSAAFRAFIRTELMPRIKTQYRTTAETAVVGESLAGLFVVETLLRDPELFDTYIAFDPSLWWNNAALVSGAKALLGSGRSMTKMLFLSNSSEPQLADLTQRFAGVLKDGGFPGLTWYYEPLAAETHRTIYHPAALRAFRTVFRPSTSK